MIDLSKIEDLEMYAQADVLLEQCAYYSKALSMAIYMENDTPTVGPTPTDGGGSDQNGSGSDQGGSPTEGGTAEPTPAPATGNSANPPAQTNPPATSEQKTESWFDKVINTIKKIFMFIPNMITKAIEKIADNRIAEAKAEATNLANMPEEEFQSFMQRINAAQNGESGQPAATEQPSTDGSEQTPPAPTTAPEAVPTDTEQTAGDGAEEQPAETQQSEAFYDTLPEYYYYQEMGQLKKAFNTGRDMLSTVRGELHDTGADSKHAGPVGAVKDGMKAASMANQQAIARGEDPLTKGEMIAAGAKAGGARFVKDSAKAAAKGAAAVAVGTAVGGSVLISVGAGVLAAFVVGKVFDVIKNTATSIHEKKQIDVLPTYEQIKQACVEKNNELDNRIQILEQGLSALKKENPDPNNQDQSKVMSILSGIQSGFSSYMSKLDTTNILEMLNNWFNKYIKPSNWLSTTSKTDRANHDQVPSNEEMFALQTCGQFLVTMIDDQLKDLLNQLKEKSNRILNWFNDPSNPILGMMSQKRQVAKIAQDARKAKGITDPEDQASSILQKIVGIVMNLGQSILGIVKQINTIINLGGDVAISIRNANQMTNPENNQAPANAA